MIVPNIYSDWYSLLKDEFNKEYFINLLNFLDDEEKQFKVFPPKESIFNALNFSSFNDTKVVIIGQDPYYNFGQANGICFSVNEGVKFPPSLRNIYKEIVDDIGKCTYCDGDLSEWAKQGVLMINSVLTVREGAPNSHKNKGWEIFTDKIIELLNEKDSVIVYMLWGEYAKNKAKLITNPKHIKLNSVHPSPLSARRGFFGCKHFSKTNTILVENNLEPIKW